MAKSWKAKLIWRNKNPKLPVSANKFCGGNAIITFYKRANTSYSIQSLTISCAIKGHVRFTVIWRGKHIGDGCTSHAAIGSTKTARKTMKEKYSLVELVQIHEIIWIDSAAGDLMWSRAYRQHMRAPQRLSYLIAFTIESDKRSLLSPAQIDHRPNHFPRLFIGSFRLFVIEQNGNDLWKFVASDNKSPPTSDWKTTHQHSVASIGID